MATANLTRIIRTLLLIVVLTLLISTSSVHAWSGECVGVVDGDSISVMHSGKAEDIRFYGIDCPEKGQAFGSKAKLFTSDLLFGKKVEVEPVTQDRYGRTVAWVYTNGTCVNKELVRAGLAWHYKKYSNDQILAALEIVARDAKVGLWGDAHPVPPWEFRRGGR